MQYEEFAPPSEARQVVTSIWRFELDPRDDEAVEHVIPPDGMVSVAVALRPSETPGPVAVGPRLSALRVPVRRGDRFVGLRCAPAGGALALLGVPPGRLRDLVVPLDRVAPDFAADIRRALAGVLDATAAVDRLRAVVAARLANAPRPDPLVAGMVDRMLAARGDVPVLTLAAGTGVSYRQSLRRFRHAVGLSPKELARLIRLRYACLLAIEAARPTWARVSAETGFADQAHLGREFSDVFGWSPELVREYLRRIDHVHLEG